MKPARLKIEFSSGGVIYRDTNNTIEVALVATRGSSIWSLPKGLINKGESPEETALREVREETGLNGRLINLIDKGSYWYFIKEENVKCKKTVYYYLMEFMSGSVKEHDSEVDEVSWFPINDAIKKASYKGDKEILQKAETMIEESTHQAKKGSP